MQVDICYRCQHALEDITPIDQAELMFFLCKACGCQYAKKTKGKLHDRWMMPITIPLYNAIFAKDHLEVIESTMWQLAKKKAPFLNILSEHMKDELENPKQDLCDIHDFLYLDETKLREFLSIILQRIELLGYKT